MSFIKSDGARIKLTFDQALTGEPTGNQTFFKVTVLEYDYVPNGTLIPIVKAVKSTAGFAGYSELANLAAGALIDLACSNDILTLGVL